MGRETETEHSAIRKNMWLASLGLGRIAFSHPGTSADLFERSGDAIRIPGELHRRGIREKLALA